MYECIKTTRCNEGDFIWEKGEIYHAYYEDSQLNMVAIYGSEGGYLVFSKDENDWNYYGDIFKQIG
jgi:hypothetical protein